MQHLEITFWGVRGTIAVSSPTQRKYGGNTSCVEVRAGGKLLILDAGSGIYPLGHHCRDAEMDILLSHTHLDHIMGLPFFPPAFDKNRKIRLWAGHLAPEHKITDVIDQLMSPPLLPHTRATFAAQMEYRDFKAGETLDISGVQVQTLPLNHPDRATGYRITAGGKSMCYITDIEHKPGTLDDKLVEFIRGADCMIYDSTFCDEDFAKYTGWGHSTWQQAVRLQQAAKVGTLALFHHDPAADDEKLDARAELFSHAGGKVLLAREGLKLTY